ncbi:josephin-like protein [Malania oleifera]|uniref:josephin-like protein n=1 Tax=Malania oleifera TaxID=397392 RepID=UPI0025AE0EC8|nr:josephin-like protein [Malania oleifera]
MSSLEPAIPLSYQRFIYREKMAAHSPQIYHEKQRLQFCLLHSLNNLFQEKDAFTRANLNAIAERLVHDDPSQETWTPMSVLFKPHHNVLTGNYDINVLIAAIEGKGKSVVWHDRRNSASSIDMDNDKLMGIVINVPVRRFGGIWRSRHWITLRRIGGVWYNLDSDLPTPQAFEGAEGVQVFLHGVTTVGGEVLLVMNDDELVGPSFLNGPSIEKISIEEDGEYYCWIFVASSMSRMSTIRGSDRMSQGLDANEKTTAYRKQSSTKRADEGKSTKFFRNGRFGLPRRRPGLFSPVRFLKHVGDKMATALRVLSFRRRPSPKVSSKPFVAPTDSHRTEAIEDCIEFINSSSTLQRSNSVAAESS